MKIKMNAIKKKEIPNVLFPFKNERGRERERKIENDVKYGNKKYYHQSWNFFINVEISKNFFQFFKSSPTEFHYYWQDGIMP